jgi:hypothetical protein
LSLQFRFTRHGANEVNDDGTINVNHGGNILAGHRNFDSQNAGLLNGIREYQRIFEFMGTYEPINNYYVRISVDYVNNSLRNNLKVDELYSGIYLFVKI